MDQLFLRSVETPALYTLLKKNYHFQILGTENFLEEENAIFVCNMNSLLDPFISGVALMHTLQEIPLHVLPMKMGTDSPLMNLFRMNQAIFIRPNEPDDDAFEQCFTALAQGINLIIYPELRPNPGNGKMLPFSPEFVQVAFGSKRPIIPMAIYGTDRVYGPKAKMIAFKGTILVKFGKPLTYKQLFKEEGALSYQTLEKTTKKVERKVKTLWYDLWALQEEKAKNSILNSSKQTKTSRDQEF